MAFRSEVETEKLEIGKPSVGTLATTSNSWNIKTTLRRYGLFFVLLILFAIFAILEKEFASANNVFNIIRMASILGILSLALTLVVCAGEFDISFAAVATLSGVMSIVLLMHGVSLYLTWILCIIIAILASAINAFNVLILGIPSFIATLGMLSVCTGLSRYLTGGSTLYAATYPKGFNLIGRAFLFGIVPTPVISFVVLGVLGVVFLEFSRWGRYTYAVGGNPEAATHAGINVKKIKLLIFLIVGFVTGVAGIIMASMFGSGNPTMGDGYLLPGIIGCFLGAVFLKDGLPNSMGTLVACLLLAVLENGFVMTNVPFYMKEVVLGAVLILAVSAVTLLKGRPIPGIKI